MKQANVFVNGVYAGDLKEIAKGREYQFAYRSGYEGEAVSLTMPIHQQIYTFDKFPPFFEGLLPEGAMLAALLKKRKLDADDYFEQLLCIGQEVVGNVTIERAP